MTSHRLPHRDATRDLARAVALHARIGDVILLDGNLGAGKTTFVKAFAQALSADPASVSSPSFTLVHRYDTVPPIQHADAYRLAGASALDGLGLLEVADSTITVVEWGSRVAAAFTDATQRWAIRLDHDGEQARTAEVEPPTRCAAAWTQAQDAPVENRPLSDAPVPDHAIVRIPLDDQGRDPLTIAYAEDFRRVCAIRTWSWSWLVGGFVAAGCFGAVSCRLVHDGPPSLSAWLAHPLAFIAGAATAAGALSLIGMLRAKAMPIAQECWAAASLAMLLFLVLFDPLLGLAVLTGLLCVIYIAAISFRGLAMLCGGRRGLRTDAPHPPEGGWPVYTVLVPLYRERAVAAGILTALEALDYPRDRLDVKFLLEADDPDTLPALQAAGIPAWCEVVVVPQANPKTKPRACNHGLERARGEFLVIFDAEDRPEPQQLKQAVIAFAGLPNRIACLQAQLAYHNHRQNLLTRWFAMEYNVWFRRYLPGLSRLRVPIPLGGTSNHFRTGILRDLRGWDPFNVTEDCDLGVRLHLMGFRTALLDSTTWEEATSSTGNWIRQRSRWLKGYFITHIVWCRRPCWLLRRLGPWAMLGFLLSVVAVPLLGVANLALWLYAGAYLSLLSIDRLAGWSWWTLLSERDYGHERWSWPMWFSGSDEDPTLSLLSRIFFIASVALLLGNLGFMMLAALGGRRPGQRGVWWAALLLPLYWVLISIAALKGLWQAAVKPHFWEKTIHGMAK